jgi:colanic acid/amylovoran biosynthesis protein
VAPHVIVSGITSCENRGVEALICSIADGLGTLGSCRVTALTQTPDHDAQLLDVPGVECVADPFVFSRSMRHGPREPEAERTARREHLLATANLMITTGGDLHTSDYGVSTKYLAAPIEAQQRNVPVAMLGHSVGPFTDPGEAATWCAAARASMFVTIRETSSWRYVVEDLGLDEPHVTLAADPAFLLPAASGDRVDEILTRSGIQPGRPYVCLAPSQGIANLRGLSEQRHRSALLSLISNLIARWHLPVLLIPHVHDSRPYNDDRRLATDLVEHADHPAVRATVGPLTAADYKGITGGSVLTIAERMHAAIGSLSVGVPTVAVGYSRKFLGVLSDTYGADVPIDNVHVGVESFVNDDKQAVRMVEAIDLMALRAALASRLGLARRRALANFTGLAEILGTVA